MGKKRQNSMDVIVEQAGKCPIWKRKKLYGKTEHTLGDENR